jgi:hypothetical protein
VMFSRHYASDIRLGERYRDTQTGIEGTATALSFYQFGCERVSLEAVVAGKIEEYAFDAPRLVHVETQEQARAVKTGGPERGVSHVRPGPVKR